MLAALEKYNHELSKDYEEHLKAPVYLSKEFAVSFRSEKKELINTDIRVVYGQLPKFDRILIKDNNWMEFIKGNTTYPVFFKKIPFY